jgi:hypothetical protein
MGGEDMFPKTESQVKVIHEIICGNWCIFAKEKAV